MKTCNRCGRELPEDAFYKVKYKGQEPKHTHAICKECTAIEQRRRYLLRVDPENPQLDKINELYAKHEAAGRSVPKTERRDNRDIEELLDNMLEA